MECLPVVTAADAAPPLLKPKRKTKGPYKPRPERKVISTRNIDAENAIAAGESAKNKRGRHRLRKELEGNAAAVVDQAKRQSVALTNAAATLRTTTGSAAFSVVMHDSDHVMVYADSHTRAHLTRRMWADIIEAVVRGQRAAELCTVMPPGDFSPIELPGITDVRPWPFFDRNAADTSVPFAYAALVPVTGLTVAPQPWQPEDTPTQRLELPASQRSSRTKAQRRMSNPGQPAAKTNQRRQPDAAQLISVGARVVLPEANLDALLPFTEGCPVHPQLLALLQRPLTGGRWGVARLDKCFF
jgi:hypothetical protein